jgi:predicted DNA-binding transcriptional regulator AlpA
MKFLEHEAVNVKTGPRSRAQRWRDVRADLFPPPAKDGQRNRWPETEIESYQRWRLAVRDGETTIERWSEWWALDRQRAEEAA